MPDNRTGRQLSPEKIPLRNLTPWQTGMARTAALAPQERQEALSASADSYPEQWASECTPPVLLVHGSQSPQQWRDHVRAELRRRWPVGSWSALGRRGVSRWRALIGPAIAAAAGICDTDRNPYREWNFARCVGVRSRGRVVQYADGQARAVKIHCAETACPVCTDRARQRTAQDVFQFVQAVARAQHVPRAWAVVLSLPARIEAALPAGSPERAAALSGAKNLLRKILGFKTRDSLLSYCAVHSCSGAEVLRTRHHLHLFALPVASRRVAQQRRIIRSDIELIDVEDLRRRWAAVLRSVFPAAQILDADAQCHVQYIPCDSKHWGQLRHRIFYDLRGFGADFLHTAPLWYNSVTGQVALRHGRTRGDVAVVPVSVLAARWVSVRRDRDFRSWGLLATRSRSADLLGVQKITDPEPEIENETECEIYNIRYRGPDPDTGRVVWLVRRWVVLESHVWDSIPYGRRGGVRWVASPD